MNRLTVRRTLPRLLCVLLLVLSLSLPAQADMGPKPSVHISFSNMDDSLCYGTLLSREASTGPSHVWDGEEAYSEYCGLPEEIWRAFLNYEDQDGYHFLQEGWQVNETKELSWTYYAPQDFKILLYYPESDSFRVSGPYESYAFASYFTVDLASPDPLAAVESYQYGPELLNLGARILLTIAVEMLVALLFGFWEKKQLRLLLIVNVATQLLLNIALNLIHYYKGLLDFIAWFIALELLIFVIEAIIYGMQMKNCSKKPKPGIVCVLYALVANGVSFAAGIKLAELLPGIF